MNKIPVSFVICFWVTQMVMPAWAKTWVQYEIRRAEFSNAGVPTVYIYTDDTQHAGLFISCFPDGLQAQLHVQEVIFPNRVDVEAGRMWVTIMHKVDTAPAAAINSWEMYLGKYKGAWLTWGVASMIKEMQAGARLSMELLKVGTIYRFDLQEAHVYLSKVLNACTKQPSGPTR
jgi:hypothetical protein